jgi:hypothetical protein
MVAVGLVLVLAFGLSITLYLARHSALLERLALSYCLGWGFLTLLMFCVSVVGLPLSFSTIATPLVIITVILAGVWWRIEGKRLDDLKFDPGRALRGIAQTLRGLSVLQRALVGFVSLFLFYSLAMASYWPVHWWDAVTLYDLRARVFVDTRSIQETALRVDDPKYVMSLPPMTSLAHAWIYLAGGANPKFFYTFLFASLLIISYHFMRQYCSELGGLTFTALLSSTFIFVDHSSHAYTNLPFACYYALATVYLYRWMLQRKTAHMIVAGLSLGLSAWVRAESEAFFLGYLAVVMLYSVKRRTYLAPLAFALLYLSIEPIWALYLSRALHLPMARGWDLLADAIRLVLDHILSRFAHPLGASSLGAAGLTVAMRGILESLRPHPDQSAWTSLATALGILGRELKNSHGVSLCLFGLATLFNARNIREHGYLLLLALSNLDLFLLAMGVYAGLNLPSWQPVLYSTGRLFMFVSPPLIYYVASTRPVRDLFDVRRLARR